MKRGFTLIELIIVISVIAILAGIVTPLIGSILEEARKARMTAEVNTLKSAIVSYNFKQGYYPYSGLSGGRVGYAYTYNSTSTMTTLANLLSRNLSRQIVNDPFGTPYYYYYYNESTSYGIGVVGSFGPNKADNGSWNTNVWLNGTTVTDDYYDAFYKR